MIPEMMKIRPSSSYLEDDKNRFYINRDSVSFARYDNLLGSHEILKSAFGRFGVKIGLGLFGSLVKRVEEERVNPERDVDLRLFFGYEESKFPEKTEELREVFKFMDESVYAEWLKTNEYGNKYESLDWNQFSQEDICSLIENFSVFFVRFRMLNDPKTQITDFRQIEDFISYRINKQYPGAFWINKNALDGSFWVKVMGGINFCPALFYSQDVGGTNREFIIKMLKDLVSKLNDELHGSPWKSLKRVVFLHEKTDFYLDFFTRELSKFSYGNERVRGAPYSQVPADSELKKEYPQTFQELLDRYGITKEEVFVDKA